MLGFRTIICLAILFVGASSFAQTTRIWGTVSSAEENAAMPGAVISYVLKDGRLGGFAISDGKGKFEIATSSNPMQGDSLKISMMGYSQVAIAMPVQSPVSVALRTKPMEIREVRVTAPKIKMAGDTLRYNVASFTEEQDKYLKDVLKRMPGIEIRSDGTIFYNGESIGNVYVEGIDVVGGRYSILSENMSVRDVKTVEVLERHQPIKALAGIMPGTKASINLKLREESIGRWIGNINLKGGTDPAPSGLWNGNLMLMRIGRKWSSVNNVKSNNTGKNLKSELSDRILEGNDGGYIALNVNEAPLGDQRSKFNTSAIFSSSNTIKCGNWEYGASAAYSYDKIKSANTSRTTYYFDDGIETVTESEKSSSSEQFVQAKFRAQGNTERDYFDNTLAAELTFASARKEIDGSFANNQNANLPSIYITDNLKYLKRFGDRTFRINSINTYSSNNEELKITRTSGEQWQRIQLSELSTDTYLSGNIQSGMYLSSSIQAGLQGTYRSLRSTLSGIELDGLSYSNNISTVMISPYIQLGLTYNHPKLRITALLPVQWKRYTKPVAGMLGYRIYTNMEYLPTAKLTVKFTGQAYNNGLNMTSLYEGYILKNYRLLSSGNMITKMGNTGNAKLALNYKNPIKMWFVELGISGIWSRYPYSVTQNFSGDYIVGGYMNSPSSARKLNSYFQWNKGLYELNGKVGVKISYTDYVSNSYIRNGVRSPYHMKDITFKPEFEARLAEWLSMTYTMRFNNYWYSSNSSNKWSCKMNFNHSISCNLTLLSNLDIKLLAQHYYTGLDSGSSMNTVCGGR